jgi:hypothetical protein
VLNSFCLPGRSSFPLGYAPLLLHVEEGWGGKGERRGLGRLQVTEAKAVGCVANSANRGRRRPTMSPKQPGFSNSGQEAMTRSGGAHPTTVAAEPANGLVHAGGEANVRIVRVVMVVREVCEAEVKAEAAEIINGRCWQGEVEVGPEAWSFGLGGCQ